MSEICFKASQGKAEEVQSMLEDGSGTVNEVDPQRQTPLHHAAHIGSEECVAILIEHGAMVNAVSLNGKTPLHHAATTGKDVIVRQLVRNGAELNLTTTDGRKWTPLHCAIHGGYHATVDALIELGADPNVVGARGWTALHQAAFLGREKAVQSLLDGGADTLRRNDNGKTPSRLAKEQKHNAVYKLIKEHKKGQLKRAAQAKRKGSKIFSLLSRNNSNASKSPPKKAIAEEKSSSSSTPKSKIAAKNATFDPWTCPNCLTEENTGEECRICAEPHENASPNEVAECLRSLGLEKYIEVFRENEVDVEAFKMLTDEDLSKLGVSAVGPRKKILSHISSLKSGSRRGTNAGSSRQYAEAPTDSPSGSPSLGRSKFCQKCRKRAGDGGEQVYLPNGDVSFWCSSCVTASKGGDAAAGGDYGKAPAKKSVYGDVSSMYSAARQKEDDFSSAGYAAVPNAVQLPAAAATGGSSQLAQSNVELQPGDVGYGEVPGRDWPRARAAKEAAAGDEAQLNNEEWLDFEGIADDEYPYGEIPKVGEQKSMSDLLRESIDDEGYFDLKVLKQQLPKE